MFDLNLIINAGATAIAIIGGIGIISAIKDKTFMKYSERMHMTDKEIAQAKVLERILKENK